MTGRAAALSTDRVRAGQAALDATLQQLSGGTGRLREQLADPLIVLVWSSW